MAQVWSVSASKTTISWPHLASAPLFWVCDWKAFEEASQEFICSSLSKSCPLVCSPAGIGEEWVLAPVAHVAVVIAVMDGLSAVVRGQVVVVGVMVGWWWRRWWGVLSRPSPAGPLAQGLLRAIRGVQRVPQHGRLGLSHSHVQDPRVVLACGRGMRGAVGKTGLGDWGLTVVVRDGGHIRHSGFEAGASSTAAAAQAGRGRRGRLAVFTKPEERYRINDWHWWRMKKQPAQIKWWPKVHGLSFRTTAND